MLCVDLMLTNCGFTDRFLRARGGWLREDERKLVESWRDIPIGLFEIRQIQRGTGVTVRTLPDGGPASLKDRLFSMGVNRLDMFCGRLFTDGARPRLLALPARVQREQREELLELLDSRPSATEIAEFFGPRPDPYMTNADGHDYFDTEVVWEIPDEPRAWARLADRLAPMGADAMEWLDKHDGKTISRGRVTRDGRRWTLWANSRERLAAFEEHVGIFGMTPRAVAASGDPGLRRKLEMELDDMEWRNDREVDRDRPPLVDVVWIRHELSTPA